MSLESIRQAIKNAKETFFLVELDFSGYVKRYATKNIQLADKLFEGKITKDFQIRRQADFGTLTFSITNINIKIANDDRLQDLETDRTLDGGDATVYIWAEGLTYSDIETDGVVFKGEFQSAGYNTFEYQFVLIEKYKSVISAIPPGTINDDTWSVHRTTGGGGSVSGLAEPMVFGNFTGGIRLLPVDTTAFKYLAMIGYPGSVDGDYGSTKYVWDKDGAVVADAGYALASQVDGLGNVCTIFDFTGDQVASEPLTCGIKGVQDIAGDLIEHPADIVDFIISNYSNFDISEPDRETVKAIIPGYKFATMINRQADGVTVIDRLLNQCFCARTITPAGKFGFNVFDLGADPVRRINLATDSVMLESSVVGKTADNRIVNNLLVEYGFNSASSKYEKKKSFHWFNNADARESHENYGARPQKVLRLTDVWDDATAGAIGAKHLKIYGRRHDLLTVSMPYYVGFGLRLFDRVDITTTLGPGGWTNEPFLLLGLNLTGGFITHTYWRIAT